MRTNERTNGRANGPILYVRLFLIHSPHLGSVQHVAEFLRQFDGGGSDKARGFLANPHENVGDAVEDINVLGIQHFLRQLVMRHVDLWQLQIALPEAHLGYNEWRRDEMETRSYNGQKLISPLSSERTSIAERANK